MKKYRIRKSVLKLDVAQWAKYRELTGDSDIIVISVESAANHFGFIGPLSSQANNEEIEFIDLLHSECKWAMK